MCCSSIVSGATMAILPLFLRLVLPPDQSFMTLFSLSPFCVWALFVIFSSLFPMLGELWPLFLPPFPSLGAWRVINRAISESNLFTPSLSPFFHGSFLCHLSPFRNVIHSICVRLEEANRTVCLLCMGRTRKNCSGGTEGLYSA